MIGSFRTNQRTESVSERSTTALSHTESEDDSSDEVNLFAQYFNNSI